MKIKLTIVVIVILFMSNITVAQEITMFPGFWGMKYYEDGNEIPRSQVATLMETDAEALTYWNKYKKHEAIAIVAAIAEVGFIIWAVKDLQDDEIRIAPLVGTVATAGISLGFSISSNNARRNSIHRYNRTKDADFSSLQLGPTYNGMGLVLNF